MDIKIALCVPTNRGVKGLTAECLMKMVEFTPHKIIPFVASEGYTIAENRNCLAARAIRSGATHMMFIDDDMVFPEDTIMRLLAHNKDIMGVKYQPRQVSSNHATGMFKTNIEPDQIPTDRIYPCDGVGTGIMLINLDVFKKIERPWFDFITHEVGMIITGEDFYFCYKAKDAGCEVWADPTLQIGHIGDFTY